jgi:transcriptional regulator with XRE-family HTH domain
MAFIEHPGKVLREVLGLTQADFADSIGMKQPHVSLVEGGSSGYGKEAVLAIMAKYRRECIQLGITAEDLLRGFDDASVAPV